MIKLKQEDPRYKLDESRKVFVYKNLHKDCWSIKQDGLVKAHSDRKPIHLYSAMMKVNTKGRERVLKEKGKMSMQVSADTSLILTLHLRVGTT